MTDEVLVRDQDGILIVTINRPEAKNAMTKAAAEGIAAAMDRLDSEDGLRVAIITGAGGTFCSGMDLKGFLRGETPSVPGRGFGGITESPPKKPLIAAVDGYALAGGLELHARVHQPLAQHPPADPRLVEEARDVVLEHACAHPCLDVVPVTSVEDHALDPGALEQAPERQPRGAGADDADLPARHGAHREDHARTASASSSANRAVVTARTSSTVASPSSSARRRHPSPSNRLPKHLTRRWPMWPSLPHRRPHDDGGSASRCGH